jgi:hypothetical protein
MRMNAFVSAQGPSVLLHHLDNFRLDLRSKGYSKDTIRIYLANLRKLEAAASAESVDLKGLVDRHVNGQPLLTRRGFVRVDGFQALVEFLARKKLLAPQGLQAQIEHLLARYKAHVPLGPRPLLHRLRSIGNGCRLRLVRRFPSSYCGV